MVRDKVAQRISVKAALDTPGVQPHAAGLDNLTGRDLPRARVHISATRIRAHLTIAVAWPQSLPQVGAAVQRNVTDALTDRPDFTSTACTWRSWPSSPPPRTTPGQCYDHGTRTDPVPGRTSQHRETRCAHRGTRPGGHPRSRLVGTLIAVLILGLGVIALRDSAVSAGWLDGRPWITTVINWIDGLTFAWWMIPAGIAAILVGAWWVYAALRPRRRPLAVYAASSVGIAPADLACLASRAAETVPGVLDALSSATLRKITVTAHTTADSGATQMKSAVVEAVRDSAAAIVNPPPKIRVRTHTGGA